MPSTKKTNLSKILVAVDGSDNSLKAADYAIEIAKRHNAELVALNVVFLKTKSDLPAENSRLPLKSYTANFVQKQINESKRKLESIGKNAEKEGVSYNSEVITGADSVVDSIIKYAKRENADLIVVGTKGRSTLKKILLGSVASGVATYSSCPVLVVK